MGSSGGNRSSETSSLSGVSSGSWSYNTDDEVSSESYDQNVNDWQNQLVSMNVGVVQIAHDDDGSGKAVKVWSPGGLLRGNRRPLWRQREPCQEDAACDRINTGVRVYVGQREWNQAAKRKTASARLPALQPRLLRRQGVESKASDWGRHRGVLWRM